MMDKKAYVLKVLDLIKDTMPLARGLIVLLQNTEMDLAFLDILIKSFQNSIDQIHDNKIKSKIDKSKSFLKELRNKETEDKKLDDEDIKHLDDILANI